MSFPSVYKKTSPTTLGTHSYDIINLNYLLKGSRFRYGELGLGLQHMNLGGGHYSAHISHQSLQCPAQDNSDVHKEQERLFNHGKSLLFKMAGK